MAQENGVYLVRAQAEVLLSAIDACMEKLLFVTQFMISFGLNPKSGMPGGRVLEVDGKGSLSWSYDLNLPFGSPTDEKFESDLVQEVVVRFSPPGVLDICLDFDTIHGWSAMIDPQDDGPCVRESINPLVAVLADRFKIPTVEGPVFGRGFEEWVIAYIESVRLGYPEAEKRVLLSDADALSLLTAFAKHFKPTVD